MITPPTVSGSRPSASWGSSASQNLAVTPPKRTVSRRPLRQQQGTGGAGQGDVAVPSAPIQVVSAAPAEVLVSNQL